MKAQSISSIQTFIISQFIYYFMKPKRYGRYSDFGDVFSEHFAPVIEQIGKLEDALYNIQFEQHWLEAQTERQAICMFAIFYIGSSAEIKSPFFAIFFLISSPFFLFCITFD